MNKKKELAKNTIIIFLGKVCTQLISFFLLPLYTGYLSTKQYGTVDLIQTYVRLLVPLITIELEMGVFRFLIDARGREKDTKEVMTNNFTILFLSLFLFSVVYLVVTQFVKIDYRFLILFDVFICTITGNLLQVARGFGKTLDYSIACIITGVTTVLLNILLIVFMGMRVPGMVISMAVANGFGALYLFIKLKMYKYFKRELVDKLLIKKMVKYSAPLVPNSLSWWIVSVSDRSIVSAILGTAANGIYAVSNKFPTLLSSIFAIFNMSWCESATLHIDSSDRDEFFSDICNTIVKLFTSLGVGLIACMPFVFPILINAKYDAAYIYIPILTLGVVFNVCVSLYSSIFFAKKMTKQVASTSVMGAITNIVVNVLLIKYIGLYAAAFSTMIAYFIMMVYRHF
ncbi:MAG: oligosaccharide flippase family protein, partial [Mycoplasmatota bacterium]|nr:oligosaccharide flippase family protein [Mycoplasmatota bacterium]